MKKTNSPNIVTVHGSAVAWKGKDGFFSSVLLKGKSGSGKSDISFQLIEAGALLISDDQVVLERRQDKIMAEAPKEILSLLEVRGLGLLKYPVAPPSRLVLVVELIARTEVPRIPEWETIDILGVSLPRLRLHGFDASAPAKIVKAIELAHHPELLVR